MQFTGLLDKNGKDIYDGDIAKKHIEFWTDPADLGGSRFVSRDIIVVVEWGQSEYITKLASGSLSGYSASELKTFEVVGNIYENPELLK